MLFKVFYSILKDIKARFKKKNVSYEYLIEDYVEPLDFDDDFDDDYDYFKE